MRKLYRYLLRKDTSPRQKLPHLAQSLTERFDPAGENDDIRLILLAGIVKDPYAAQRLMQKHDTANAPDLLDNLPPPKVDRWRRLRAYIRLLEGAHESDPHRHEYRLTKTIHSRQPRLD